MTARRIVAPLAGSLMAIAALLSGCLGGDGEPTATGPVESFALESGFNETTGFYWKAVGGPLDGQVNPVLRVPSGSGIEVRVVHGSGPGDNQPHNLRVMADGEAVADSPDVKKPGDETTLRWTPPADGAYQYLCKYHGFGQGASLLVGDVAAPTPTPSPSPEPLPPAPPPEPVAYTLVSQYDLTQQDPLALPALSLHWKSDAGETAGQLNPSLTARVGVPVTLTVRHGGDLGDLEAHQLAIALDGTELATAPEVAAAGNEAVLEWTPPAAGAYTYHCKKHATMAGSLSVGLTVATVESSYDQQAGFRWAGVGGAADGAINPTFTLAVNETLRMVYRHGNSVGDDQIHNLRFKDPAGEVLVDGADVAAAGDEASIEWAFAAPGAYAYQCKYHPETQKGAIQVA